MFRLMQVQDWFDKELCVGTIDECIAAREDAMNNGVDYKDFYFMKHFEFHEYYGVNVWVYYDLLNEAL